MKFIFAELRCTVTFILLLFSKLFADAVHLCQTVVVTRAYFDRDFHEARLLKHWQTVHVSAELIAFVGRGLLKSNYSPRPYLPNRARGLPWVYLTEAGEEPSIAKENNYPSRPVRFARCRFLPNALDQNQHRLHSGPSFVRSTNALYTRQSN